MKEKETIVKKYGYLFLNGKYYEPKYLGDHHAGYTLVDNKEVEKKIKMMKEIAERIKNSLDQEAVMMEALSRVSSMEDLQTIHNAVFNEKRKLKPKTREHHCVDMKIGNIVIPIVD